MKPYGFIQQYLARYLEGYPVKALHWEDTTSPEETLYRHRHIPFIVTQYYSQYPKCNNEFELVKKVKVTLDSFDPSRWANPTTEMKAASMPFGGGTRGKTSTVI